MKKLAILIVPFLIASCTGKDTQQQEQAIKEFMESYAKEHTDPDDDLTAEYDEERDCIHMKWKCKMFNVSYDIRFKDLLTENPTSYADGFMISMVLFFKGVTQIDRLEFVYEGIKYKMLPCTSETLNEKGVAMAGFLMSDKTSVECLKMLSVLSGVVTGKIYTNKGPIDIPIDDVYNLRGMARSYVIDGGTFDNY